MTEEDLARPDWATPRMAMHPATEHHPRRAVMLQLRSTDTGEEWEVGGLLTQHAFRRGSGESKSLADLLSSGSFVAVGLQVIAATSDGTPVVVEEAAEPSDSPSGEGETVPQPEEAIPAALEEQIHRAVTDPAARTTRPRPRVTTLQEFDD